MGILTDLKAAFFPKRIADPVIGTLRWQPVGFWEGKTRVASGSEIEFVVEAGADGPTDEHRHLFKFIMDEYKRLLDTARVAVDRKDAGELITESLAIANGSKWEIVFVKEGDNHYFCVDMDRDRVVGVRVEG